MKKNELLNYLKGFGNISYYSYKSPCGGLALFGDRNSLKSIIFQNSALINEFCRNFPLKLTGSIKPAISFFEKYFSGNIKPAEEGLSIDINRSVIKLGGSPAGSEIHIDLTPFTEKEQTVYFRLLEVPFGKTISYGKLSENAAIPCGARFVGNAMAKNIYPILIPCHRVIRSDGKTGNYSGGNNIKKMLIRYELTGRL